MKVIVDANVFLSYLAAPETGRTITWVVGACLTRADIELVLPPGLIEEVAEKVASKQYFQERIPQEQLEEFIRQLRQLAALPPPLEEIPPYSRDPEDDYLIAYGLVNEVNYLVTGDPDLLVLRRVENVAIVEPSQFLDILQAAGMA